MQSLAFVLRTVAGSPKQPREILAGVVVLALIDSIRDIHMDIGVKIVDSGELCKAVSHLTGWCEYWSPDTLLFPWLGWSWMGGCGEIYGIRRR